jgi:predicted DCC family thiol-disulfide oxidoreductase YuxK
MSAILHTTPPGRYVLLYDGHCRFCTEGSQRLEGWMRRGSVERADFQQPGDLDRFPGLTHAMCMERLHLVAPDGRVFAGVEAIVRAAMTRPFLGVVALLYFVPGFRQLLHGLYRIVAANRYRLMGKAVGAGHCEGGTCALQFSKGGKCAVLAADIDLSHQPLRRHGVAASGISVSTNEEHAT